MGIFSPKNMQFIGIGIGSVSADMKKKILVIYQIGRYRPIWKKAYRSYTEKRCFRLTLMLLINWALKLMRLWLEALKRRALMRKVKPWSINWCKVIVLSQSPSNSSIIFCMTFWRPNIWFLRPSLRPVSTHTYNKGHSCKCWCRSGYNRTNWTLLEK